MRDQRDCRAAMMKPLIAACVCGSAAIAAGVSTLPRVEERSVMFSRDGDISSAMKVLEAASRSTPSDPKLLLGIHQLQEQAGDAGQSIRTLEAYLRERPRDTWGWDRLATLYGSTMEPEKQKGALERLIALNPKSARVSDLLGLYFKANDEAAEYRLLSDRKIWSQLRGEEFRRLGSLALKYDHLDTALEAFRQYDRSSSLKDEESRLLLLDLLIRSRLTTEAGARLVQWSSAWTAPQVLDAVRMLSAVEDADRLATMVLKIAEHRPGVDLQIASGLAASGKHHVSRAILSAWSQTARPKDHGEIKAFIAACASENDLATAIAWYRSLSTDRSKAADAVLVADRIYHEFGADALSSEHHGLLKPDRLALRPLFGAQWALELGNPELAVRALWLGNPEHVEPADARRYADLLFDTLGPAAVLEKLQRIKDTGLAHAPEVALALDEKARISGFEGLPLREDQLSLR